MTALNCFLIYLAFVAFLLVLNYRFWQTIGKDENEYYNTNQEHSERTPNIS